MYIWELQIFAFIIYIQACLYKLILKEKQFFKQSFLKYTR